MWKRLNSLAGFLFFELSLLPSVASSAAGGNSYPEAKIVTYQSADGDSHVYAVQDSTHLVTQTHVLIYMHGSAGLEEQGMQLFPSLRRLLHARGWIYICPRDEDYKGLLREIENRYGKQPIFLSGASAGGSSAFEEAIRNPGAYSGLILMCPAISSAGVGNEVSRLLTMPVWIVAGERDNYSVEASRRLYQILNSGDHRVHYHEIPKGNHNAPLKQIEWERALDFLTEAK